MPLLHQLQPQAQAQAQAQTQADPPAAAHHAVSPRLAQPAALPHNSKDPESITNPTSLPESASGPDPRLLHPATSFGDAATATAPPSASSRPLRRSRQRCRFHATNKGCRAGEECPFRHDAPRPPQHQPAIHSREQQDNTTVVSAADRDGPSAESLLRPVQQPQTVSVRSDGPIQRPTPQKETQDPRAFQINQITRRYRATLETTADGTPSLHFKMTPSDPDFPFEIEALECVINVPVDFPQIARPSLRVTNKTMERGYQLNVERGFDEIWTQLRQRTLLNAMKLLDKQLEKLLTAQKAEVFKIVANSGLSLVKQAPPMPTSGSSQPDRPPKLDMSPNKSGISQPSSQRIAEARSKREAEIANLESRLQRDPQFAKAGDGTIYTVPIEPRKRKELPLDLQAVKAVRLFVPPRYDIEPCSVELLGVEGQTAANVEASFLRRVQENKDLTLMMHVNYLAQNMHTMTAPQKAEIQASTPVLASTKEPQQGTPLPHDDTPEGLPTNPDKSHIRYIARPPEWDAVDDDEDDDDEYSDEGGSNGSLDSDKASNDEQPTASAIATNGPPREAGIALSFPNLTLHNIELLELSSLSVSVKCSRCKTPADILNLTPFDAANPTSTTRSTSCKKCSLPITAAYRADLMHANSPRAGYLDLDGADPLDLLPSRFLPTCAACSTTADPPGVSAVRAASNTPAICRACHSKLLFTLPDVRFLRVGPAALAVSAGLPLRKAPKENLGIVAGQPLPRNGTCAHYRKSLRWFRFSCCARVYPCDRCHDDAADHPEEFANRMICGFCSREQNYRPDDCGFCHNTLTGKAGRGFWEGGKGTRDPARMSRKDPRKYKRITHIAKTKAKAKEKNERK